MKSFQRGVAVLLLLGSLRAEAGDKDPPVVIILGERQASATPWQRHCSYAGGGNVQVRQSAPDSVTFLMTGAAGCRWPACCAEAGYAIELTQCFEVVFNDPKIKRARIELEGETIGLLRSSSACCCKHGNHAAISTPGNAVVQCGPVSLISVNMPPRSVGCGESVSINDREGPIEAPVTPGKYTFHQIFGIRACQSCSLPCKTTYADFAPGEVFKEDWLGKKDPFRGTSKKEFGFQVVLRIVAEESSETTSSEP